MNPASSTTTTFIVLSVVLFMLLGIAILVAIDKGARVPGAKPRRDHPRAGFAVASVLLVIIAALLFEIVVAAGEKLGAFVEEDKPELLQQLREDRFSERMRHFHNEPTEYKAELGRQQACFYCHGHYPHSKQVMVRTLLNMHTQFIGCMTCHTDPDKIPERTYSFSWLNFSGIEVTGPPYGTSIDPDSGLLVRTDDYYSKVVIYADDQGEPRLLELTEDSQEVRDFAQLSAEGKLEDRDSEAIKIRFHSSILRKGRTCSRCHAPEDKSYLPFRKLGFSEQRVNDLTDLDIVGIVEKYREFHLPVLYEREPEALDESTAGRGDNESTVSSGETIDGMDARQGDGGEQPVTDERLPVQ
jgi:hypothetical protein